MVTEISKYGKMMRERAEKIYTHTQEWYAKKKGKNSHKPLEIDIDISQTTANIRERKKERHERKKTDTYLRVETWAKIHWTEKWNKFEANEHFHWLARAYPFALMVNRFAIQIKFPTDKLRW